MIKNKKKIHNGKEFVPAGKIPEKVKGVIREFLYFCFP